MSNRRKRASVAVLGAGIGGLTAARTLRASGMCDVVVYEREQRAGGVIRTSSDLGFVREHAANGFLPVKDGTGAIDLAEELGVEVVAAAAAAKKRWIYRGGRLHELPSSPVAFLHSELLTWRGKLSLLAEPLRPRRDRSAGDESIHAFASRRLGREVADAMVAPFVTGIFAGDANQLSVQAGLPALANLEDRGGLVVGQIKSMSKSMVKAVRERRLAKRAGQTVPARKPRSSQRLSAPKGGVGQLIDALSADLGDALRTETEVTRIAPGPEVHLGDGSAQKYDAVVLATPAHVGARLCRAVSAELADALEAFPYVPVAVVYLGVERADVAHALNGFGFLVAEGEDLRVLGTVFESVVYPARAPADHVLFRCIFGGARDPDILSLSDDELIACARRDLDRALGDFARVEPVHEHVVRWPRAIAQYNLGHTARVRRAETLAGPLGIVLAGSAYHGVAVNKVVADAGRVCRAVRALTGVG